MLVVIRKIGLENILKSKVYIGSEKKPLVLRDRKDCIPYYPYVIESSFTTNGIGTFRLTSKSWVDIEEERYGHMSIHDYYRSELKKEMEKSCHSDDDT